MIDFRMSDMQKDLRSTARRFANTFLKPYTEAADQERDAVKCFAMMKEPYREAHKLGFTHGFFPVEYGGMGLKNIDLQIVAEEICAVDPGFACILLVNGLALKPVEWFGSEEQKQRFIGALCRDETHEFIAGWVVSEPEGTACFDDPAPYPAGIKTMLQAVPNQFDYRLNGQKFWPSSQAGWDGKGADLNTLVVRVTREGAPNNLACCVIPRGAPGVTYNSLIEKYGQRSNQNGLSTYEDVKVPSADVFAWGDGDLVISKAFTWSGPVAGIAAVGATRTMYEAALEFAKTWSGGGAKPIINHQAVGYHLADVAMEIEAARYLCWKSAHYLDSWDSEGQAFGAFAKVWATEAMHRMAFKCMQVVGVNAIDKRQPFDRLYREVSTLPLYDAGNMGMQRRKVWGVMKHPSFDPQAFVMNKPVHFVKEMEGAGF